MRYGNPTAHGSRDLCEDLQAAIKARFYLLKKKLFIISVPAFTLIL